MIITSYANVLSLQMLPMRFQGQSRTEREQS